MEQYISKATVVAEIKRRKKYYENIQMIKPVYESNIEDFNELLSFLDTLEVREIGNIWHDASEELPVIYRPVLLYTEEGTITQGMHDGGSWILDMWVPKFPKILKWCYLSDVLPSETTKD